jgi:hypothetical protein
MTVTHLFVVNGCSDGGFLVSQKPNSDKPENLMEVKAEGLNLKSKKPLDRMLSTRMASVKFKMDTHESKADGSQGCFRQKVLVVLHIFEFPEPEILFLLTMYQGMFTILFLLKYVYILEKKNPKPL